ncbi:hypothetical protein CNMCM7691_007890 [Aspergillus felis]|uniref:oryzin n=1 Tax=Aspergillus felis TaxID=1287682 RepID=A0A8H6V9P9_9EURO|nr:hypothetical protein CNMCM7691_007890 [Aspergillus felis]
MVRVIILFLALLCVVLANPGRRSYETRDYFALQLDGRTDPHEVANVLGAEYEGPIGELPAHHTFSFPKENGPRIDSLSHIQRDERMDGYQDGILWAGRLTVPELQKRRVLTGLPVDSFWQGQPDPEAVRVQQKIAESLNIKDPLFREQWHLFNPVQLGNDLNVTGVWLEGITGENATTAIVDDGLDIDSLDLQQNYYAGGSYDFNDDGAEPRPRLPDDHHGTRCAGEIAAARNDVCGIGVAYNSRVSGIRLLSGKVDDIHQAAAINYDYQHNDIYSCSWGPPDDGMHMQGPAVLVQRAIVNGVQNGRGGKGSIFVFSAGNGASQDDNCNFDGYANSIYSITVGAIDRMGKHPPYSESCSALLLSAFSSGSGEGIYTTDNGVDTCFSLHSGTSAAGPLVAGVVALALSARPDLTWRDVQYLLIETAIPVHVQDGSWQTTSSGRMFSHDWGYGKVDAYSLVQKARTWNLVKRQAWYHSPWLAVHAAIPEGHTGVSHSFNVTSDIIRTANIARLEHVTVTINIDHISRGDISVTLISPERTISYLSTPRVPDRKRAGYVNWDFTSVAHWGETGIGIWTIIVQDINVNNRTGAFINWRLNLWGEAIDDSHQPLHPLPGGYEEKAPDNPSVAETVVMPSASDHQMATATAHPMDGQILQEAGSSAASAGIGTITRHSSSSQLYYNNPRFALITAILTAIIFLVIVGLHLCFGLVPVSSRNLDMQLEMRNSGNYRDSLEAHESEIYCSDIGEAGSFDLRAG